MNVKTVLALGIVLYLAALSVMHLPSMLSLDREELVIEGPGGVRCPGTVWMPSEAPRAVLLAGHGVTANRGIMALIANVFARNGYAAVAFDFPGHGGSRERFDWHANTDIVEAWCDWAREHYPGLPLVYLGYSMGGFAGTEVFLDNPMVDAFVALGALPRRVPDCPTLVAAGRFEELFTIDQARARMEGAGAVVTSPFSDHATEAHDPVLVKRILSWVHATLGMDGEPVFPWAYWAGTLLALVLGVAAALLIACQAVALFKRPLVPGAPRETDRAWSLNPYRIAGRMLGCRGAGVPPNTGSLPAALAGGLTFTALSTLLLSWLLDRHLFTSSLSHPERLLTWLVLAVILVAPVFLDAWVLERLPLTIARKRFAVASLTRATPLLVLCLILQGLGPGIAFTGMMFGILAFVMVMLSLVHALAVRATGDWRAGACASAFTLAWLIAFWFPLSWPWV